MNISTQSSPRWFPASSERVRDTITGYLFVAPAVLIIVIFGLFPILFAMYMSVFQWRVRPNYTHCLPYTQQMYEELPRTQRDQMPMVWQLDFGTQIAPQWNTGNCFANYTKTIGDWGGAALFVGGFVVLLFSWWLWMRIFDPETPEGEKRYVPEINPFIRLGVSAIVLAVSLSMIVYGWNTMFLSGNQDFLNGLTYTIYYAVASVPIQLALGLLLAYILFQNIRGKTLFRMIFFIPYITPVVAAATVFRIIFSARPSSLANQALGLVGIEPQKWIAESDPFIHAMFGIQAEGFLAGPSMSMVSVVILGIWMYVGYNTIIYLAGLGQIPGDLYEAARVDGASDWHIFRYITLPLLSPVTFYLSVLGFIGTFKSFNSIFVMRVPEARGTTDTAAIIIFDTFRKMTQYGEATAQAIILMLIILAITQFQRSFLEKRVFYG